MASTSSKVFFNQAQSISPFDYLESFYLQIPSQFSSHHVGELDVFRELRYHGGSFKEEDAGKS